MKLSYDLEAWQYNIEVQVFLRYPLILCIGQEAEILGCGLEKKKKDLSK